MLSEISNTKTPQARSRSRCSSNSSSISNLAAISTNITPSRNHNFTTSLHKGQGHSKLLGAGDRYVCIRNDEQLELAAHLMSAASFEANKENLRFKEPGLNTSASAPTSPASKLERETKKSMMRVKSVDGLSAMGGGDRVCAFRKGLAPLPGFGHKQPVNVLYSLKPSSSVKRSRRYVAKSPERILDAPGMRDDYYATLTDWSKTNIIAVALEQSIYLWHADSGDVDVLVNFEDDHPLITLVKWSQEGRFLSLGFADGSLKIYDVNKKALVRTLSVQMNRIACGSWSRKGLITYGTRSGRIYHHDVKVQQSLVGMFDSHSAEVCGLKWSDDEQFLTSGGADALVNVWEHRQVNQDEPQPIFTFNEHVASVKAVEYVPFIGANMVATGGGTQDQTIRIWNLSSGTQHSVQNAQSQVTGLLFNRHFKEMMVGNGNPNCGVRLWKYEPSTLARGENSPSFEHVADLKSAGGRVLGLCQSPCGEFVMSTCDDETMRLWHVWKQDASCGMKFGAEGMKSTTGAARKRLELGGNVIR